MTSEENPLAQGPISPIQVDVVPASTDPIEPWAIRNAGYIAEYNGRVARGELTFDDLRHI